MKNYHNFQFLTYFLEPNAALEEKTKVYPTLGYGLLFPVWSPEMTECSVVVAAGHFAKLDI